MSPCCGRCGKPVASSRLGLCPHCLLAAPLPSVTLGDRLELHELIGEGGMGSVFRAYDKQLEREVAVKLLNPELGERAEFRQRFEREARALAMLNHPGIVTVFDAGVVEAQSFITMELLRGESLAAELPVGSARALSIGEQLCDALAYAHARGVVHRDIKPENVLLAEDGRVLLTDFGIARVSQPDSGWTITAANMASGTPHYMAPEALRGARPDPRMDIYALGVLLYQMLSGELPQGDFRRLEGGWDSVIRRALAPDPADRYADAKAFGRALRALRDESEEAGGLAAEDMSWMRAAAAVQTAASAVALWAVYTSIIPRVVGAAEIAPLTVFVYGDPLPDGRLVTIARFEPWPIIAAVISSAIGIACYALLRRHWRRAGLERRRPEQPVTAARVVLFMGAFNALGFIGRLLLQARGFRMAATFVPILGGISECVTVYLAWLTCLELWRNHRPLRRELGLWVGLSLSALPPLTEYVRYLATWRP